MGDVLACAPGEGLGSLPMPLGPEPPSTLLPPPPPSVLLVETLTGAARRPAAADVAPAPPAWELGT